MEELLELFNSGDQRKFSRAMSMLQVKLKDWDISEILKFIGGLNTSETALNALRYLLTERGAELYEIAPADLLGSLKEFAKFSEVVIHVLNDTRLPLDKRREVERALNVSRDQLSTLMEML